MSVGSLAEHQGELFSRTVHEVKQRQGRPLALLCSYVYDAPGRQAREVWEPGYLPTREAWDDGGYEVSRTPFAGEAEEAFKQEVQQLLESLG